MCVNCFAPLKGLLSL